MDARRFSLAFAPLAPLYRVAATTLSSSPMLGRPRMSLSKASSVTRRQALSVVSGSLAALAVSAVSDAKRPAAAESMLEAQVRGKVTILLECRDKAGKLKSILNTPGEGQSLSEDEKLFVLRATTLWLNPALDALRGIAKSDVDLGYGVASLRAFSKVLPIHLGELDEKRRAGSRAGVLEELDEYVETLEEALKVDSLSRFVSGKRWNGKEWKEAVL